MIAGRFDQKSGPSLGLASKAIYIKYPPVIFERTMKRSETLQKLATHRDELTQMGVKTLADFGSVARDEARSDSDVDIMVEFKGPAAFKWVHGSQVLP